MHIWGKIRVIIVMLLGMAATACSHGPVSSGHVVMDNYSTCLRDLAIMGAKFKAVPEIKGPNGCGVEDAVQVSGGIVPWNRPTTMTCSLARKTLEFEDLTMNLAIKHFGQGLKKIHHMGTYACRERNNSATQAANARGQAGKLSEHGLGKAIDISAYELADGTMINVKRDWFKGGTKAAFLRDVARQACRKFNIVLTPNHDKFHHDHLHFDIGRYTACGI